MVRNEGGPLTNENHNEYHRNYQKKRYAERKAWAHSLLGNICARCGDETGPFDVDHIDPTEKTFQVSTGYSKFSKKRLAEELEKCQLLCQPCHITKSRKDLAAIKGQREYWEHGTLTGYRTRRCRCDECARQHRDHYRQYMNRRREVREVEDS